MSEPRRKLSIRVPDLPWKQEGVKDNTPANLKEQPKPNMKAWNEAQITVARRWAGTD